MLITALAELNKPRRASLPGLLRAAAYQPILWTTGDIPNLDRNKIGLRGSPTIVSKTWVPESKHVDTEIMQGDSPSDVAGALVERLYRTDLRSKLCWL